MTKAAKKAVTQDEGEILEGPTRTANPDNKLESIRASIRRTTGGKKGSEVEPDTPDYTPRASSQAYLSTRFGSIPSDLSDHDHSQSAEALTVPASMAESPVGGFVIGALEDVRESWAQVDQARPSIMRNEMETRYRRLDQLDRYASERRVKADKAVDTAIEKIDTEITETDRATKESLRPKDNEASEIMLMRTALMQKDPGEVRAIVEGALDDPDGGITVKAALGAPEWQLSLGTARGELMRQLEDKYFDGRAMYRDKLRRMRERLDGTKRAIAEHFDSVIQGADRADLREMRKRESVVREIK